MHKCTTLTCQYSCKIFSRKKSNRDTVQKQHTNKLNRSRPFYLLSIRSKKIDSSEFHKQIQDFELPTSWDFFWRAKKAGKHYQNVMLIPQILHTPFTCYHYILKKFTALNYTNKFMTLICPFISLFFLKRKKSREKLHNHIAQSLNTLRPLSSLSIRTKKIYSSEFHKQVHNFDLSNYFRFFLLLREMSRETVQKHVFHKPNTSRPFYLWLIRSKKIYSSEFHKQIHDFDPFTPSLHNQLSNFNQGYLEEKNCFLSISNWPMLYCNLKNWGGLFMSLKDKFFLL